MREVITEYQFPGDDIAIIRGSAHKAMLNIGDAEASKSVVELLKVMDEYFPVPERDIDKPFLMPIEDVFSISGRGTVVTGRAERGNIKVR